MVQSALPLHSERECKQTIGIKESVILFLETFPVCVWLKLFQGVRYKGPFMDSCVCWSRCSTVSCWDALVKFLTTGRGGRVPLNKGGSYPIKSYLLCDIGATTFYSSSLCCGSPRLVTSSILGKYYPHK